LLTASGVAAVTITLMALCKQGDHVVLFAESYQPSRHAVRRLLSRYGVSHTLLSIEHLDKLEETLKTTPTRLVLFESPTNPLLKVADIERLTTLARANGALTVLDNTFAGFHNHGQFDIDVFVHSLTKYASGHGDVMGGAVIARRDLIDAMKPDFIVHGSALDPHTAFLIQRGLKTYFLRYDHQCATASAVARFLESHPSVKQVRYPGLVSHPQHALASKQMLDMGTLVTFDLQPHIKPESFANALKLFTLAASVGSTESLIQPGQLMMPRDLNATERDWAGVTAQTMRLSCGIEDQDDLIADLNQAFDAAG
jgi:cystathionine beta-lyase/cystathionine gamma-synthase